MVIHVIFCIYAILAVSSALMVITARDPVKSVLSLVLTFFAMAGVWMLLHAEFLAIILVLVYVGAVMTLFLFVVMMLNINAEKRLVGFVNYLPFGATLAVLLTVFIVSVLGPHYFGITQMPIPATSPPDYSNTAALGRLLYSDYAYPFEVAGVILLTAMIAAISLAHHAPRRRKNQRPDQQIAVQPRDRLRLVNLSRQPVGTEEEAV